MLISNILSGFCSRLYAGRLQSSIKVSTGQMTGSLIQLSGNPIDQYMQAPSFKLANLITLYKSSLRDSR